MGPCPEAWLLAGGQDKRACDGNRSQRAVKDNHEHTVGAQAQVKTPERNHHIHFLTPEL